MRSLAGRHSTAGLNSSMVEGSDSTGNALGTVTPMLVLEGSGVCKSSEIDGACCHAALQPWLLIKA